MVGRKGWPLTTLAVVVYIPTSHVGEMGGTLGMLVERAMSIAHLVQHVMRSFLCDFTHVLTNCNFAIVCTMCVHNTYVNLPCIYTSLETEYSFTVLQKLPKEFMNIIELY